MGNTKIIVALGYKAQAGKDTCAKYLVENYGFTRLAFADGVKTVGREAFNWNEKKDDRGRKLLQGVGLVARDYDMDFWINKLENSPKFLESNKVVIPDTRFQNEVSWVRSRGGYLVKIDGRGGLEGEVGKHASEVDLDGFEDWDFVVDNSSLLAALHLQLDSFMKRLSDTL